MSDFWMCEWPKNALIPQDNFKFKLKINALIPQNVFISFNVFFMLLVIMDKSLKGGALEMSYHSAFQSLLKWKRATQKCRLFDADYLFNAFIIL